MKMITRFQLSNSMKKNYQSWVKIRNILLNKEWSYDICCGTDQFSKRNTQEIEIKFNKFTCQVLYTVPSSYTLLNIIILF